MYKEDSMEIKSAQRTKLDLASKAKNYHPTTHYQPLTTKAFMKIGVIATVVAFQKLFKVSL